MSVFLDLVESLEISQKMGENVQKNQNNAKKKALWDYIPLIYGKNRRLNAKMNVLKFSKKNFF